MSSQTNRAKHTFFLSLQSCSLHQIQSTCHSLPVAYGSPFDEGDGVRSAVGADKQGAGSSCCCLTVTRHLTAASSDPIDGHRCANAKDMGFEHHCGSPSVQALYLPSIFEPITLLCSPHRSRSRTFPVKVTGSASELHRGSMGGYWRHLSWHQLDVLGGMEVSAVFDRTELDVQLDRELVG